MATLAGTRVKDTYQGMLKTSDAATLTTSLKVIEDGVGNSSALSLSTTTVKAATLQIDSVTGSSSSGNALVWNSSTKAVEYRSFPSNETVTTTLSGSAAPAITITAADSSSTTVTFAATDGLAYSRTGNTITIGRGDETINTISVDTTLTAADSGNTYLVDASSGLDITLPSANPGVVFKFIIKSVTGTGRTQIIAASGDYVYGKAVVTSNTATGQSRVQTQAKDQSINAIQLDPDASSKGGNVGDVVEVLAVDSTDWLVNANLTTSSSTVSAVQVMPAP
jgi:hypothetical protein